MYQHLRSVVVAYQPQVFSDEPLGCPIPGELIVTGFSRMSFASFSSTRDLRQVSTVSSLPCGAREHRPRGFASDRMVAGCAATIRLAKKTRSHRQHRVRLRWSLGRGDRLAPRQTQSVAASLAEPLPLAGSTGFSAPRSRPRQWRGRWRPRRA